MSNDTIDRETTFFAAQQQGPVMQVFFKEIQANWIAKIDGLRCFLAYLDIVALQDDIRVVVLLHPLGRVAESRHYYKVVDMLKNGQVAPDVLQMFFKVLDQYMMHIAESKKFFIDVHAGNLILDTFLCSFACDYRILADNAILKKPGIRMGLVPKGIGTFLLRQVCTIADTYRLLLTDGHQSAYDLLRQGFVNQVITFNKLEATALETAVEFSAKAGASLEGIKQLMNHSFRQLNDTLKAENRELARVTSKWQH